jgi:hypothetical protein
MSGDRTAAVLHEKFWTEKLIGGDSLSVLLSWALGRALSGER